MPVPAAVGDTVTALPDLMELLAPHFNVPPLTVVKPASSFDLTVLATVKAELGIADRASDAALAGYIKQASEVVAKFCNRVFALE